MNELALFAGSGGGILGGHLLGWKTICAVERDAYAAQILAQRQNDRILDPFPIWSDVTTFDGGPWAGIVDLISGGFPCQDISAAGKGAGITGDKSGLWKEMARIIREVGPKFVYVENSPMLTSRGLGVVLGDLAAMGYVCRWGVLGASDVGAPHQRKRIWILAANPDSITNGQQHKHEKAWNHNHEENNELANAHGSHGKRYQFSKREKPKYPINIEHCWWSSEPGMGRVANGVAHRVDRLKAIGNGQVPEVARNAFEILSGWQK